MLEHRARDDLADALSGQAEAGHQAVERRGEQVLVARGGVGAVRPREGDAVAAKDRHPSNARRHLSLQTPEPSPPTYL